MKNLLKKFLSIILLTAILPWVPSHAETNENPDNRVRLRYEVHEYEVLSSRYNPIPAAHLNQGYKFYYLSFKVSAPDPFNTFHIFMSYDHENITPVSRPNTTTAANRFRKIDVEHNVDNGFPFIGGGYIIHPLSPPLEPKFFIHPDPDVKRTAFDCVVYNDPPVIANGEFKTVLEFYFRALETTPKEELIKYFRIERHDSPDSLWPFAIRTNSTFSAYIGIGAEINNGHFYNYIGNEEHRLNAPKLEHISSPGTIRGTPMTFFNGDENSARVRIELFERVDTARDLAGKTPLYTFFANHPIGGGVGFPQPHGFKKFIPIDENSDGLP